MKITCMPPTAYNRTIAIIRDYPRMVCEYERLKIDTGVKATSYDGIPKATKPGNGLEEKAVKLADLEWEIKVIQDALSKVPEDMRDGIINNIIYGIRFPLNSYGQLVPSLRTWKREKSMFVTRVAHALRIY